MATEKQLLNLANMILNDPALEAVHKRVAEKMLERFRGGSREEREQINAIMDAGLAFLEELQIILDDAVVLAEEEEKPKTKKPRGK